MSVADEIVRLVKGVTPYLIGLLFAFCIVYVTIQEIEVPTWIIAMLSTGAGGVGGAAVMGRRTRTK